MNRTLKMLALPALMLVVGLVVGFALGQRQGLGMGMRFLDSEVQGMLSMHVEAASSIRIGDTDRALAFLDSTIDSAVINRHAQPASQPMLPAMSQAKVYRDVIPAQGPNAAEVRTVLETVPAPAQRSRSLEKLIARR